MSVTKRQGSRNSFGSTLPVLLPLYDSACEPWQFAADEEILCGTSDECQFRLNHESIAARHCALTLRAGTLTIRRIDGRIWLNEIPVSSEAILTAGDIVSIGPVTLQVDEITRPAAPTPDRVIAAMAQTSIKQTELAASPVAPVPQQIFQPAHLLAPAPFLFAPTLPASPPPLPAVFLEDHSAKISAAAESLIKERTADIESRERLLQAREQQLQELELLIRDRERICSDRQSTLDERVQVLSEQKTRLDEQRAQAEAMREQLNQHKLDLERRQRQQSEREDELASQLESSAHGYAQIERTRGELSARLTDIQQRESQLEQHRRELEELASWINSQKDELQASTTAVEYRAAELHSKEAALNDTAADLTDRQQSVTERENSLRQREASLAIAEQRVAEATLRFAAAEARIQEADEQIALAESTRSAAEETNGHAERKIQEALEQFRQLELARHELDRQRHELETLQQGLQSKLAQTTQLEEQLTGRASDLDEKFSRLAMAQRELEAHQQAVNLQQTAISEQTSGLDDRARQLDLREAELSARIAQTAEDSSGGTRSVEQLMAIAAEREAAIRSRQEAARATEELKTAKATIAEKEQALTLRQQEIENRGIELADRVLKLKAERNAVRLRERELEKSTPQSQDDAVAVHEQHQRLLERQAALMEREARATERENAANVVLRNAEAEREALQMSHKDLICERNALMQFSQDLNSRASGLTERESIVSQQTEELRSRFHAMNQQSSDLQRLENELNLRAADLHRRVVQFKTEIRDQKRVAAVDAASGVPDEASPSAENSGIISSKREQELSEALQLAESQLNGVQTERDALLTAVRELQRAMMDAREDVEEANRLRAEATKQEQTLATLYQTIEERSGQLQLLESRLRQAEDYSESLEKQLQSNEPGSVTGAGTEGRTAVNFGNGHTDSSELEAELMRQLEAVKDELKSVREASATGENSSLVIHEQKRTIDELRQHIEVLQAKISDLTAMNDTREATVSMIQVDELQAQLTRATEVISDRDDLIRELRMRISQQSDQAGGTSPNENFDAAELQKEARELDRRASLLDAREEEVRERLRMVSNAEEQVEAQRRQLLDARQQLELARTEIQVAMKQHASAANYAADSESDVRKLTEQVSRQEGHRPGDAIFGMEADPVNSLRDEGEESSGHAALDLRAELASLFGLNGRSTESAVPERISHEEVPDTSEPLGAAQPIALHFGEDASKIVSGHKDEPAPESSASASNEDTGDDFVRDYMEQLLSRSRKSAGNSLPSELSGGSKGKSSGGSAQGTKKPEPAAPKGPPKVKSYIDQYMAGGSLATENHENSDSEETIPEARGEHADDAPIVPRVKVDVEKLRQNMNSFRSVSTQSVEKALVTHALRTERLSINGRIFLVCVMGFMSVFLAIANYKGIINHPVLIWVTLIGAIGAGIELTRKMYAIKSKGKALVRCEESCAGKNTQTTNVTAANNSDSVTEANSTSPVPPPLPAAQLSVSSDEASGHRTAEASTSPYTAIVAVTANEELAPVTSGLLPSQKAGRQEKDEYFEL